jgi:hypothetical protein
MTYERPTYESGAAQRDAWPYRPQTPLEIIAAAKDPENLHALVMAFHGHRQSIREHEESRKEDQ